MDRGRKRKMEEKEKTGKKILMPEVFISNYMKQQRNFVKYKREVRVISIMLRVRKERSHAQTPRYQKGSSTWLLSSRSKGTH